MELTAVRLYSLADLSLDGETEIPIDFQSLAHFEESFLIVF